MKRISQIIPADRGTMEKSREKWNAAAKPLHSLGLMEDIVIKLAGIFGSENFDINKRCAVDMCADNGVVCEGVTQTDSSVTAIVAEEMARGNSNINLMAKTFGADVFAVDIGIDRDVDCKGIIHKKIAYGTKNITCGAAMTADECEKAVAVGIDMVRECKDLGYKIIITGEMGIGNTTTTAAITSVLTGRKPAEVAGRGAGLDDEGLKRKISAVERAISVNAPFSGGLDILSKVGGFDIAGMTGLFLGGAVYRLPVIIDGAISAAAACIAAEICADVKDYMICSHASGELSGRLLLERLGMKPVISAEMRLGEGTGGVMLLPMIDAALAVYNSSHKFTELNMEAYKEL